MNYCVFYKVKINQSCKNFIFIAKTTLKYTTNLKTQNLTKNLNCFDKTKRLLAAKEFKSVFDNPIKKIHSEHFLLFIKKNDKSTKRLGLAITKKKFKKAVDRNKIKRQAREQFRLQQHNLPNVDCVLIAKKANPNTNLYLEINGLFFKLSKLKI